MRKADALAHYENDTHKLAAALGISRQAVEQWGELVPETSAWKLQAITGGAIKVNAAAYAKLKKQKHRAGQRA